MLYWNVGLFLKPRQPLEGLQREGTRLVQGEQAGEAVEGSSHNPNEKRWSLKEGSGPPAGGQGLGFRTIHQGEVCRTCLQE